MGAFEAELYEDLAADEAEGAALMEDEFEDLGMDEMEEEFDEEFEEGFEAEAYEDDAFFDEEGMDEFDLGDEFDDELDAYEEDYEDAEEALDNVMAYALGAEDADEFFGRLFKGLKKIGGRVVRGIRKAAPVVGKIASGVSRVASMIPHPYAQAVGRVAGLVGRGANLVQRLRAEGASEEEALDAFAELAVRDPRALPIVAGLAARTVLKSKGARMSPTARKQAVKQMKGAAKTLVRRRGPAAVRALPKIAKSVKRTAAIKRTTPATAVKAVRRTAAKVARSPALTRKLARPSVTAKRRVAAAVGTSTLRPRSYVIPGPARITITAA
jgi:hypothetical protein